jgi:hypothetical protein
METLFQHELAKVINFDLLKLPLVSDIVALPAQLPHDTPLPLNAEQDEQIDFTIRDILNNKPNHL